MLFNHLRCHLIVAPNTNVGKSIFATGLCRASRASGESVAYLKPVGTGDDDVDDESHIRRFTNNIQTACLFRFDEPVSPHLAAQRSKTPTKKPPTDDEFAAAVGRYLRDYADVIQGAPGSVYVETAGGVHSPTLSGSSQLDTYRSLLLPTILVASHELGGISTTIAAYESLVLRGYTVDAVVTFREETYRNFEYFQTWFAKNKGIPVSVVDLPPAYAEDKDQDRAQMENYYTQISAGPLKSVVETLKNAHSDRIANLKSMPRRTLDSIWWPFVQHGFFTKDEDVMVIDSAKDDYFDVYQKNTAAPADASLLNPMLDGSASWWTQCLGHANPELTLAAAYAAGRYGHVMFPTATHEPALKLAERMLATMGNGWASKVFFSDDGSTSCEVGLKMALKSYSTRFNLTQKERKNLKVLGLKGSYHGDTIGSMNACEANVYNDQVDWYDGKGFWLESTTVHIEKGNVIVRDNTKPTRPVIATYASLGDVYDVDQRIADGDPLVEIYRTTITDTISEHLKRVPGFRFGTLIIEPIVMGAGGMIFVDPLYQRVLIDVVRTNTELFPHVTEGVPEGAWQGLPVIFDEVFVGLYRLGRMTTRTMLGANVYPDVACYAKILTGGLLPLALTLASSSIFDAFYGDKKVDCLLHGHSYTAHPIGCAVANRTLELIESMVGDQTWGTQIVDWSDAKNSKSESLDVEHGTWSLWNKDFVYEMSMRDNVSQAYALGCVLIIELKPHEGAGGYESRIAELVLNRLRFGEAFDSVSAGSSPANLPFNVHARPLGNLLYFMSSLTTKPETIRAWQNAISVALDAYQKD